MKAVKISQACEVQMQFCERNVKAASEGTRKKCKEKITFHKNDTYMQHWLIQWTSRDDKCITTSLNHLHWAGYFHACITQMLTYCSWRDCSSTKITRLSSAMFQADSRGEPTVEPICQIWISQLMSVMRFRSGRSQAIGRKGVGGCTALEEQKAPADFRGNTTSLSRSLSPPISTSTSHPCCLSLMQSFLLSFFSSLAPSIPRSLPWSLSPPTPTLSAGCEARGVDGIFSHRLALKQWKALCPQQGHQTHRQRGRRDEMERRRWQTREGASKWVSDVREQIKERGRATTKDMTFLDPLQLKTDFC